MRMSFFLLFLTIMKTLVLFLCPCFFVDSVCFLTVAYTYITNSDYLLPSHSYCPHPALLPLTFLHSCLLVWCPTDFNQGCLCDHEFETLWQLGGLTIGYTMEGNDWGNSL